MNLRLEGRVAVVTGASKGIGAGIAKTLAEAGATVVVNFSTDQKGADAVVSNIVAKGGKAIAVQGSVAKAAENTARAGMHDLRKKLLLAAKMAIECFL